MRTIRLEAAGRDHPLENDRFDLVVCLPDARRHHCSNLIYRSEPGMCSQRTGTFADNSRYSLSIRLRIDWHGGLTWRRPARTLHRTRARYRAEWQLLDYAARN